MRNYHHCRRAPGDRASSSGRSDAEAAAHDAAARQTAERTLDDTNHGQDEAKTPRKINKPKSKRPAPAMADKPTPKKKKSTQIGDFKLLKRLGKGGMGEVFLAHQVSLDRKVAFKTLSKQLASKKSFIERFYREARSMAKLDHPHVVRGYAVGEADGIHYVAMEFIDGRSLHDWMKKLARIEIGDAVHVAIRCAEALEHAHELNIIHRDIKPDNVLVTKSGIVKVADLGLAKALDDDMSMTQSGTGLGTPYYMPPEQARNAKYVDGRSDIYALGCMLYYCVTGAHPFEGDSTLEIITAKERGIFKSARRVNPAVPERLDLIIDKALAKDPSHRYQTCTDLINDLDSLQMDVETLSFAEEAVVSPSTSRSARHTPRARRSSAPSSQPSPTPSPGAATPKPRERRRPVKPSSSSSMRPVTSGSPKSTSGEWWYVQYRDSQGKKIVSKLRTAQVQQQLKAGNISTRAKGKTSADAAYAPLASFPQFLEIVEQKLIKKRAAQKQEQFNHLYDRIDREERWYRRWRGLRRFRDSLLGGAGLIVYLAIIAAVIAALWFAFPYALAYLRETFPNLFL